MAMEAKLSPSMSFKDIRTSVTNLTKVNSTISQASGTKEAKMSTIYTAVKVGDLLHQPSLARLQLEIVLCILEEIFNQPQLVKVNIFGLRNKNPEVVDLKGVVSGKTKVVSKEWDRDGNFHSNPLFNIWGGITQMGAGLNRI
ncbi:hypothetical protein N0V88_004856 [Collariella sp. IMI 366227]|nr:hypothetical protein N0V88_004856 [Collariella sp. IMI 366227]